MRRVELSFNEDSLLMDSLLDFEKPAKKTVEKVFSQKKTNVKELKINNGVIFFCNNNFKNLIFLNYLEYSRNFIWRR